jgi:hypothetical protein
VISAATEIGLGLRWGARLGCGAVGVRAGLDTFAEGVDEVDAPVVGLLEGLVDGLALGEGLVAGVGGSEAAGGADCGVGPVQATSAVRTAAEPRAMALRSSRLMHRVFPADKPCEERRAAPSKRRIADSSRRPPIAPRCR